MNELSNGQIFLDNLIYLDFTKAINYITEDSGKSSTSLLNIIQYYLNDGYKELYLENNKPCEPTGYASMYVHEWDNLLNSFLYERDETGNYDKSHIKEENADSLGSYIVDIDNYETHSAEEGAFRACTFLKKDETDSIEDVIVVFRDTAGNAIEWEDNIMNACREDSNVMNDDNTPINKLIAA